MDVNSVENLSEFLISCAFRRCVLLGELCRLSVSLAPLSDSMIKFSVSDTGDGTKLKEFQDMKFQKDMVLGGKWDGVIFITTTRFSDKEIHHLKYDFKEPISSRTLMISSITKNGSNFSGTEQVFSAYGNIDHQANSISAYLRKILVLNSPKIAVDLKVENAASVILQNACMMSPANAENIRHLKMGLESYVSRHGNTMAEACSSCFPFGKNFKVGKGTVCRKVKQGHSDHVMEAVIILSEISDASQSPCSWPCDGRSEVLYFRDFSPCSLPQACLDAFSSIQWKNYGLVLKGISDNDGMTLLEWENFPPGTRMDIALHEYHKQLKTLSPPRHHIDRTLTTKAIKLGLEELKAKNGVLLSERALKVQSYAPDLAATISSLIFSSNDVNFQEECCSLLGLEWGENNKANTEKCIKDRIVSIVAANDINPKTIHTAPSLFTDDSSSIGYSYASEEEQLESGDSTGNDWYV